MTATHTSTETNGTTTSGANSSVTAGDHTPGPWTIEDPMGPEALWIVEARKKTYEWRCIAMVRQDDPTNDEDRDPTGSISADEQKANARLIAAAPSMFEYIASSASAGCATAQSIVKQITGGAS